MKLQPLNLKPSQITAFLIGVLSSGRVPYIHGSPGIGKSDLVHAVADHFGLKLIDFRLSQCDPTDLNGFPVMENGRSTYAPNKSFPIEGDDLPLKADGTPYKGWFLFFDELASASRSVQAASYKILLDRAVGDHKLHPAVMMAAAGNKETDGAIVEEMSSALKSRLTHASMVVDHADWVNWAYSAKINPSVIAFLQWKPAALYNFKPDSEDFTFPCPRTWHMASDLLKTFDPVKDPILAKAAIAGTISQATATEFMSFCALVGQLPTMQEVMVDPLNARVPTENGHLFAMAGAISAHFDAKTAPALYQYLGRLGIEYQVIALRSAIARDMSLMRVPEIMQWARANAKYLQ